MPVFDKIYETVKKIPKGYVSTYGDIAFAVGNGDSDAVGVRVRCQHQFCVFFLR